MTFSDLFNDLIISRYARKPHTIVDNISEKVLQFLMFPFPRKLLIKNNDNQN